MKGKVLNASSYKHYFLPNFQDTKKRKNVNMTFVMGSEERLPQWTREKSAERIPFLGFCIRLILSVIETKGLLHRRNVKRRSYNLPGQDT